MTPTEEKTARDKVWRHLVANGWKRVSTMIYRRDSITLDLDAAKMTETGLRPQWAIIYDEIKGGD